MTEFKSAFIDTSPFIYYIEKSELYFEKQAVSEIDWSQSVAEIDKQFYAKYALERTRNLLHRKQTTRDVSKSTK